MSGFLSVLDDHMVQDKSASHIRGRSAEELSARQYVTQTFCQDDEYQLTVSHLKSEISSTDSASIQA